MKKRYLLLIGIAFLLASCSATNSNTASTNPSTTTISDSTYTSVNTDGNTTDVEIADDSVTSTFSLTDENGTKLSSTNGVYTINAAGTYTATGKLEGQIYVDATGLDVELVLDGASITNDSVAPIYVKDVNELTIKAKNDSANYIYDTRTTDYSSSTDDSVATGAIYVLNGDLKLNGKGSLSVISSYNSGIHGRDNVKIKNLTLLVKAMNNGIKGNDKVTIEENPTIGIVCGNNGITTSNSEVGSSSQHGYIYINGGTITINSYGDGIDAAYAVEFGTSTDSDNVTYSPVVDIYTNKYSSYSNTSLTSYDLVSYSISAGPNGNNPNGGGFNGGGFSGGSSAEKADDSAKGIKANEYIKVTAGKIFTYTYDDGLHTNNDKLDSGVTAKANITISGGELTIKASDDGIHADGTLTIEGGTVYVAESHEGLEGKTINITGGDITVFGSDDGVNASSAINISGGRLDVTVPSNGDYDGIDSNGTITITGGIIITRGPNSEMMSPLDADGTMKMTGGILIVIGYAPQKLSVSGLTKTTSNSGLKAGSHTVTVGSTTITYNNTYSYSGSTTVYASSTATVK